MSKNQKDLADTIQEKAIERIARRIAKEKTGSEDMWELFLTDATTKYFKL